MTSNKKDKAFIPLNIAVLTVSGKTKTLEEDSSGALLADLLTQGGHRLIERALIEENLYKIRAQVAAWIANSEVQAVLVSGGTGLGTKDCTPEAMECLIERRVDGFGELFRQFSVPEIGISALQSRAFAGLANRTLVCCLPSSSGACRTAWQEILSDQLDARGSCNFVSHLI